MLAAVPVAAQTTTDEQLWFNATAFGSVGDKAVYFLELQPRFGEGVSDLDQLLARGGVGWKLSKKVTLYQGYAYVETPRDGTLAPFRENRSFQQLNLGPAKVGSGALSGRTRLEQRWRGDGDDVGWRLRQQIRYAHPLAEGERRPAALGWAEGFWNLNDTDWRAEKGFDRVRAFAGFELPVSGKSTVELGYMNQTVNNPGGTTTMHHVASISLFLRH